MSRSKVMIRFTSEETDQLESFCRLINMDKETVVKRAVLYAMNDTLQRAEAMRQEQLRLKQGNEGTPEVSGGEENGTHNTTSGDSAGDQAEVPTSEGTDSSVLANQETTPSSEE